MAKPAIRKPKKKANPLKAAKVENIDYKDAALLRKFISDRGKIRARRVTGVHRAGAAPHRQRRQERARDGPAAVLELVPLTGPEGATTMKVILTHEVTGLGTAGDVVDVKDGYARNFLFRRGLATAWTKGGQKQVDAIAKGREVREVKSLEEAQSIKGNLESKAVTVAAHAGTGGRLFGAVSTADIADAVKAAGGPALDKRKIEVPTPIKTTGTHSALVRLHPEVQATVELDVVAG